MTRLSVKHRGSPASNRGRARNTDLIRISDVGAEYECADWLPASSTCCSSGSRRINRARSFSAQPRVAMLYDRGGQGRPGHAHGPVPVVCFQLSIPRPVDGARRRRRPSARCGSCACQSVTAVILTSHASRMKSDRCRPSTPLSGRHSTLRPSHSQAFYCCCLP